MGSEINYVTLIFSTGVAIFLIIFLKSIMTRVGLPSMIGYILLGFTIRLANNYYAFITPAAEELLVYLSKAGVVILLFRVGLDSDLPGLLDKLGAAIKIWLCDITISGLVGFCAAYYVLSLDIFKSLMIASAFTATSVGVSVAVWKNKEALSTESGRLLIDVAELDDISAVVIMAVLFVLLPVIHQGGGDHFLPQLGQTLGVMALKFIGFGIFCWFFSRYVEHPVTGFFKGLRPSSDYMIIITAMGFIIAALAGILGFSLAIGAFFAGLIFSRDPDAVKNEANFLPLYEFFSPFFFVGIGYQIDPNALTGSLGIGAVLAAAAVVGKIVAVGPPVYLMKGKKSAALIGVSMVPRAEICMIIMHKGLTLGGWAVTPEIFGGVVMVSLVTCILSPPTVRYMLDNNFNNE